MNIMLLNVVAPIPVQSNDSHAAVLGRSVVSLNAVDSHASTSGPPNRDVERFLSALHATSSQYFRMLAEAPRYLTPERMRDTANEAQAAVDSIRDYQRRQSEEDQARLSSYPAATIYQPTAQIYGSSYTTPMLHQASQDTTYGYYSTPGMSTQSSSQDFDTGSSQYRMSPQTGPSSIYEPVDHMLLSPFPGQHSHHRMSRSSQASQHGISQRGQSGHVSLSDTHPQAGNGFGAAATPSDIDPRLLSLSHDYYDPENQDVESNV